MMNNTYRVLILDDEFEQGELVRAVLVTIANYSVDLSTTVDQFWELLNKSTYDVIFLDYKLKDTTGLVVLEELARRGCRTPTIMMTGEGNERIAAQTIQAGAFDYLVKGDFSLTALPTLIQKAVQVHNLQVSVQNALAKQHYQAMLLNNMRDAVVVWNQQGAITYWNQAACELFGRTAEELIGKQTAEVYLPAFSPVLQMAQDEKCESCEYEYRYQHPNGKAIWISSRVMALHDDTANNQLVGYMDVSRDVTAIRSAQERLTQSVRLAAIGQLAASIAHSINNPLTTIIADAQILAQSLGNNHPAYDSAADIETAGWRAQRVVQQLLQFSQPPLDLMETVSINQTIEHAALLLSGFISTSGALLQLDLADNLPEISVNAHQIEDLWVHLLLFGREMPDRADPAVITIHSQFLEPDRIEVDVTDNWFACTDEELETIFEPHIIPAAGGYGTGMELSVCQEIAWQNNGTISAARSGSGITFKVLLSVRK
jgi:PAS domain S-box-containing protein